MDTRIEIYKDGLWQKLRLAKDAAIKYNAVINKVGKVASREISHTNTFQLPNVYHNLQVLGLNVFNPLELAKAMNSKYEAKYYVEDKILQIGYLVINNTNGGTIKVNFIEESLSLTSRWGSITFEELLRDDVIEFPADYAAAIEEVRDYDLDKNNVLTPLGNVGSRGYNLCLFPNNLNAIGEDFQKSVNDIRLIDSFNPYQSRPLWNAKSVFDLATEAFGYTPEYDDSVDWDKVAETFIIADGGDQSEEGANGIQTIFHPTMTSPNTPYFQQANTVGSIYKTLMNFDLTVGLKPNDIPNWVDPTGLAGSNASTPWMSEQSVFVPNTAAGNVGSVHFIADYAQANTTSWQYDVYLIWKNATPGGDVIVDHQFEDAFGVNTFPSDFTIGTTYKIDLEIDKVFFEDRKSVV